MLVSLVTKDGFSQWGQIPDNACYAQPSFGISYNSPYYFLTDSAAIYSYHTIGGNTQATTLSYYLCESTNDNATVKNFSNGIGGLGCCSSKQIVPLNSNQVVFSQNSFLSTKVVLKTNNSAVTLFTVPGFENNFAATANQHVYCIWRKYTFTNNYLFFNRYINGGVYSDTLKYYGIKTMPKIYFASDSVGYIFGKDASNLNYIARSNDYGVSWTKILSPASEINDIKFEGIIGYAVGANGTVYQSLDNGINWNQTPGFTTKNLNSVSAMNSKCYIAGDSAALFHSFDFGLNWIADTVNIIGSIDWVKFTANDNVYFQSSNKLYKKGYYSSILEINKNAVHSLILYPNPASDMINIEFQRTMGEKYNVTVINYLGQEIFTNEDNTQLDISDLSSGMYYIIIRSSKKESYRGTFIKTQ